MFDMGLGASVTVTCVFSKKMIDGARGMQCETCLADFKMFAEYFRRQHVKAKHKPTPTETRRRSNAQRHCLGAGGAAVMGNFFTAAAAAKGAREVEARTAATAAADAAAFLAARTLQRLKYCGHCGGTVVTLW